MKIHLCLAAVIAAVCFAPFSSRAADPAPTPSTPPATRQTEPAGGKTLYHVVSFRFKPSATPEQIKAIEDAFAALKDKVPGIASIEWGRNVSPEKHNDGFTHAWIVAFKSEKDRDAYLVHPDHKAFGKLLGPVLDKVFVIDFWSESEGK